MSSIYPRSIEEAWEIPRGIFASRGMAESQIEVLRGMFFAGASATVHLMKADPRKVHIRLMVLEAECERFRQDLTAVVDGFAMSREERLNDDV